MITTDEPDAEPAAESSASSGERGDVHPEGADEAERSWNRLHSNDGYPQAKPKAKPPPPPHPDALVMPKAKPPPPKPKAKPPPPKPKAQPPPPKPKPPPPPHPDALVMPKAKPSPPPHPEALAKPKAKPPPPLPPGVSERLFPDAKAKAKMPPPPLPQEMSDRLNSTEVRQAPDGRIYTYRQFWRVYGPFADELWAEAEDRLGQSLINAVTLPAETHEQMQEHLRNPALRAESFFSGVTEPETFGELISGVAGVVPPGEIRNYVHELLTSRFLRRTMSPDATIPEVPALEGFAQSIYFDMDPAQWLSDVVHNSHNADIHSIDSELQQAMLVTLKEYAPHSFYQCTTITDHEVTWASDVGPPPPIGFEAGDLVKITGLRNRSRYNGATGRLGARSTALGSTGIRRHMWEVYMERPWAYGEVPGFVLTVKEARLDLALGHRRADDKTTALYLFFAAEYISSEELCQKLAFMTRYYVPANSPGMSYEEKIPYLQNLVPNMKQWQRDLEADRYREMARETARMAEWYARQDLPIVPGVCQDCRQAIAAGRTWCDACHYGRQDPDSEPEAPEEPLRISYVPGVCQQCRRDAPAGNTWCTDCFQGLRARQALRSPRVITPRLPQADADDDAVASADSGNRTPSAGAGHLSQETQEGGTFYALPLL